MMKMNKDYDRSQTGMHNMMQGMTGRLEGKTGEDFDRIFLDDMIVHHQGAVKMAELAQKNAGRQEIKDLSAAIIAAQNKEIADMQNWRTQWFGAQSQ